jgi:hypothetical protein
MANDGSSVNDKARAAFDAVQTGSGLIPGDAVADGGIDTTQLADEAVTPAKLAKDDLAANETVTHDDASATVLLTAPTGVTLAFICNVKCTETVVDGGGGAPTFSAGDGTVVDAFVTTTEYATVATSGDRLTFGGELAPGEALTITPTDGTGGDAGAFLHTVVASPITDA